MLIGVADGGATGPGLTDGAQQTDAATRPDPGMPRSRLTRHDVVVASRAPRRARTPRGEPSAPEPTLVVRTRAHVPVVWACHPDVPW